MDKGCCKISIKRIGNLERPQVIFSKRRKGLIRKIRELFILSDCEIAFLTESSGGKIFSFRNLSPEVVIDRLFSDLSKTKEDSNIFSYSKNQYVETQNEVEIERKKEILPGLCPKLVDGGESLWGISGVGTSREEEEEQYLISLIESRTADASIVPHLSNGSKTKDPDIFSDAKNQFAESENELEIELEKEMFPELWPGLSAGRKSLSEIYGMRIGMIEEYLLGDANFILG